MLWQLDKCPVEWPCAWTLNWHQLDLLWNMWPLHCGVRTLHSSSCCLTWSDLVAWQSSYTDLTWLDCRFRLQGTDCRLNKAAHTPPPTLLAPLPRLGEAVAEAFWPFYLLRSIWQMADDNNQDVKSSQDLSTEDRNGESLCKPAWFWSTKNFSSSQFFWNLDKNVFFRNMELWSLKQGTTS